MHGKVLVPNLPVDRLDVRVSRRLAGAIKCVRTLCSPLQRSIAKLVNSGPLSSRNVSGKPRSKAIFRIPE